MHWKHHYCHCLQRNHCDRQLFIAQVRGMVLLNLLSRVKFLKSIVRKCACQPQSIKFSNINVSLSFTMLEILYGPSYLNASLQEISFFLLVQYNETMSLGASSSYQIIFFFSAFFFQFVYVRDRELFLQNLRLGIVIDVYTSLINQQLSEFRLKVKFAR